MKNIHKNSGFSAMTAVVVGGLALLLIAGLWTWGALRDNQPPADTLFEDSQNSGGFRDDNRPGNLPGNQPGSQPDEAPNVRLINVNASPFKFEPAAIRVKQGERVRIVLNNQGGMHDWVIDEFNARTPVAQAGQTVTAEFTADRTGTFEYYCSVGNHRQMGMVGQLIVE